MRQRWEVKIRWEGLTDGLRTDRIEVCQQDAAVFELYLGMSPPVVVLERPTMSWSNVADALALFISEALSGVGSVVAIAFNGHGTARRCAHSAVRCSPVPGLRESAACHLYAGLHKNITTQQPHDNRRRSLLKDPLPPEACGHARFFSPYSRIRPQPLLDASWSDASFG